MYIVSIVNTSGKIFEVAANINDLSPICDMLENSGDVVKFKVSGSQGEIDQKVFGFGGYMKWHLKFNEQIDVSEPTVKHKVIPVIHFDNHFTFINEMYNMSKRGELFEVGTICQVDKYWSDHKEFIMFKDSGYLGAGWYNIPSLDDSVFRDWLKEIHNIKDDNVEFVFELGPLKQGDLYVEPSNQKTH